MGPWWFSMYAILIIFLPLVIKWPHTNFTRNYILFNINTTDIILKSTNIRTQAIGIVQASDWGFGALSVKFFPQMKDYLSFHGLFFLYGAIGFVSCLWGLKTIPDNRGKSLVKVEEMYEKKTEIKWIKKVKRKHHGHFRSIKFIRVK